jgi:hypothetical protein
MGRVQVLESLLPGACGRLWLRLFMPGIKGRCFPRTQLLWLYPVLKRPLGVTVRGLGACRARLRGGARAGRQAVKFYPLVATGMGERKGTDRARVYLFLGWWSLPFSQEWWDRT